MKALTKTLWVSFCVVALAACSSPSNGNSDGGTSDGGNGATDGGNGLPASCVLPAMISTDMTLTTACDPWHVTSSGTTVAGSANPVLTIAPGVTVAFDKGGFLSVGTGTGSASAAGGLVAVGTSAAGITFTSSAPTPAAGDWTGVALGDNTLATSAIAYATFEYGGGGPPQDGYSYDEPPAELMVYSSTASIALSLHHLTVSHSGGNGIVLDGYNVGFGAGSGHLTVTDWGAGDSPFVVSANQASTLPATLTAGSGGVVDLICGDGCPAGTGGAALVALSQTWPAIPLPYLVDGKQVGAGGGVQIEGAGNSTATLTIAAPNTLEFKSGGIVEVDPNGTGQAAFVAAGAITFTSDSPSPTPGAWGGLQFNAAGGALANSALTGVTVDWAGDGTLGDAVILIRGAGGGSGPAISGCTIENYPAAVCGIVYDPNSITPPASYAPPANVFTPAAGGSNTICSQ